MAHLPVELQGGGGMPVRIGWGKRRENLPLQVGESPWESPGGKLVRIYRLRWGKEGENSQVGVSIPGYPTWDTGV